MEVLVMLKAKDRWYYCMSAEEGSPDLDRVHIMDANIWDAREMQEQDLEERVDAILPNVFQNEGGFTGGWSFSCTATEAESMLLALGMEHNKHVLEMDEEELAANAILEAERSNLPKEISDLAGEIATGIVQALADGKIDLAVAKNWIKGSLVHAYSKGQKADRQEN
jgi:hypothetical protein